MATPPNNPPRRLNARQRRFVEEYAATKNAVRSYLTAYGETRTNKAGETVPRSYQAAAANAHRLLKNAQVRAEVNAATKAQLGRTRISADRWLRQLTVIADASVTDCYEPDPENGGLPKPRPLADIPPATRQAIKSIRVRRKRLSGGGDVATEIEDVEYRLHDPFKALELIAKHLNFFAEQPPLDQLLAMLPPHAAGVIRKALAQALAEQMPASTAPATSPPAG